MDCHCIRSSELPHTTRLFADFLDDFSKVASFYAHPPNEEGLRRAASEVRLDPDVRRDVVEVLREQKKRFGGDAAVEESLERLAAGAAAVVTGQQVGIFGGPAYSFYKALTAIAVAKKLTAAGVDAVPVFWMATEDHDLAEVNHGYWLGRGGVLERVELSLPAAGGHRVGEILLGPGVGGALEAALGMLEGPGHEVIGLALRESYRPQETFGSAFGKLFARLLAGRGVIILDALDPGLHRLAAPVYRRVLEEHTKLAAELMGRSRALDRAGYHAQVKVTESSTLLFVNVDGERRPLRGRNNGFAAGRTSFTREELLAALSDAPERFSPNVLLRPVVQDSLLPTAVYVGGPAEMAYFAQAQVLYQRLLGRMPAVVPRASFTLVEAHVARLLKKYGIEVRDVWRGRQHLRARLEREFLPRGLTKQFDSGEKSIRGILEKLRRPIGKLDRTLLGAVDTAERKMLYQFLRLRGKAGRAENFRTGVLDTHERILVDALYPHHGLQERSIGLPHFLAAHGLDLLDSLESRAASGGADHHVLFL